MKTRYFTKKTSLQTKFQSVIKFPLFLNFRKSNDLGTESTSTKWRENDLILIPEDPTQSSKEGKGNSPQYHDSKFCIMKFLNTFKMETAPLKWNP